MSRPRFLADSDLNEHIITGFLRREPAAEMIPARDASLDNRPDPEVLNYAASHHLIVVSHDVNTMIGHAYARIAEGKSMAGLLMIKQSEPIGPVIESLRLIWAASEAEEWQDVVAFLPL